MLLSDASTPRMLMSLPWHLRILVSNYSLIHSLCLSLAETKTIPRYKLIKTRAYSLRYAS
jgi:hypothetical protein